MDKCTSFFVYKLSNKLNEIVYIGKTHDLPMRMKKYRQPKYSVVPVDEITKTEYIVLSNECDCNILESYLIDYYKPKYNTDMKFDNMNSILNIKIPTQWREYTIGCKIDTSVNYEIEIIQNNEDIAMELKEEYLRVDDIAKILGFGKTKTYSLINLKEFPKIKIGNALIIPKSKFEEFMEKSLYKTIDM